MFTASVHTNNVALKQENWSFHIARIINHNAKHCILVKPDCIFVIDHTTCCTRKKKKLYQLNDWNQHAYVAIKCECTKKQTKTS